LTVPATSNDAVATGQAQWLATRRYLIDQRLQLARSAVRLYPELCRVGDTPLLAREGWLLDEPLDLDRVTLRWSEAGTSTVDGGEAESASVRPLRTANQRFSRYSDTVRELAPPTVFENRPVYRFTAVDIASDAARLGCGLGRYFACMDVGEAVAHEYAAQFRQDGPPAWHDLPLRQIVGDPTDPARRSMNAAFTTVTVRFSPSGATFIVHWRDPAKVATNAGMYQVLPVGVFQPAGGSAGSDFDLWRGMVREYSEELLDRPEHHHVDYDAWPFYSAMESARRTGGCRAYLLGLGVDPLTLAADLLTAVVFEADVFDSLFATVVATNAEGTTRTVAFSGDEVHELVNCSPIQPAGAAALSLAWRWRSVLLRR
jgi:hypothetical protein